MSDAAQTAAGEELYDSSPVTRHSSPKFGQGGEIRTHDLVRPRHARYQAAPHPEVHIVPQTQRPPVERQFHTGVGRVRIASKFRSGQLSVRTGGLKPARRVRFVSW